MAGYKALLYLFLGYANFAAFCLGANFSVCLTEVLTPSKALECFRNTYTIDASIARQHVEATREIFDEFYVYGHLIADPASVPQSNPFNYSVFPDKVDLLGELEKLALSFPSDGEIPLMGVIQPVNDIFNRLRDAHVGSQGRHDSNSAPGKLWNGVGESHKIFLSYQNRMSGLSFTRRNGKVAVKLAYLNAQGKVKTNYGNLINGGDPASYFEGLVSDGVFPLPFRSVGVRINELFHSGMAFRYSQLGNTSSLDKDLILTLENGDNVTLSWAIDPIQGLTPVSVAKAKEPGFFYEGLKSALDHYRNRTGIDLTLPNDYNNVQEFTQLVEEEEDEPDMQGGRRLGSSWTKKIITDANGDKILSYGCKSKKYCIWKLNTFVIEPKVYFDAWLELETMAKKRGVTKLMYDVNGNGGGRVMSAYLGVKLLFPRADPDDVCDAYDKRVGPMQRKLVDLNLDLQTVNENLKSISIDDLQKYFHSRNENCTEFITNVQSTAYLSEALGILLQASVARLENKNVKQRQELVKLFQQLQPNLDHLMTRCSGSGVIDRLESFKAYLDVISLFIQSAGVVDPLQNYPAPSAFKDFETVIQGGQAVDFTGKFTLLDCAFLYVYPQWQVPYNASQFNDILFVGSGYCGSACDRFTQDARFYSIQHNTSISIKHVAYGGTGKESEKGKLVGSSYGGGTVTAADQLTSSWAYYTILSSLYKLTGIPWLDGASQIEDLIPRYPYGNTDFTPFYTDHNVYLQGLGDHALPSEFYNIPADEYIQQWYSPRVNSDMRVSSKELKDLYNKAEGFFET